MIDTHLRALLADCGLDPASADRVSFHGTDPILPTRFRFGTASAAALGAVGLALSRMGELAGRPALTLQIDLKAAAASLRSDRYVLIDGKAGRQPSGSAGGYYQAAEGRWNYLHCVMPRHRDAISKVLGVTAD